jgi:hypothetical protein
LLAEYKNLTAAIEFSRWKAKNPPGSESKGEKKQRKSIKKILNKFIILSKKGHTLFDE